MNADAVTLPVVLIWHRGFTLREWYAMLGRSDVGRLVERAFVMSDRCVAARGRSGRRMRAHAYRRSRHWALEEQRLHRRIRQILDAPTGARRGRKRLQIGGRARK